MNKRKSGLLVVVLAVVLLSSMVGMVSAGESQPWYMTNTQSGLPSGADYRMDKDGGKGLGHVEIPSVGTLEWGADQSATVNLDMGGSWTGNLHIGTYGSSPYTASMKIELGKLESDGTFIPCAERTNSWPGTTGTGWTVNNTDPSLSPTSFPINTGEALAVRLTKTGASEIMNLLTFKGSDPDSPSYITYPYDDPDYPVPELSTILLTGMGLLMLGGFVIYNRRRNNKD